MSLNKHALKQVVEFWAYFSLLLGYIGLATFMAMHYGDGWMIGGLGLPLFVGMSYIVYS